MTGVISVIMTYVRQLEALVRDKLKNNYYEVRKRFKDNDPEGRGNVARSVVWTFFFSLSLCLSL